MLTRSLSVLVAATIVALISCASAAAAPSVSIDSYDAAQAVTRPIFSVTTSLDTVSLECRFDNDSWGACSYTGVLPFVVAPNPITTESSAIQPLGDGNHAFQVRGLDASSVPGDPQSAMVLVVTSPPTPSFTTTPPDVIDMPTTQAAEFAFTASQPGATFKCQISRMSVTGAWKDAAETECVSPMQVPVPAPTAYKLTVWAYGISKVESAPIAYSFAVRAQSSALMKNGGVSHAIACVRQPKNHTTSPLLDIRGASFKMAVKNVKYKPGTYCAKKAGVGQTGIRLQRNERLAPGRYYTWSLGEQQGGKKSTWVPAKFTQSGHINISDFRSAIHPRRKPSAKELSIKAGSMGCGKSNTFDGVDRICNGFAPPADSGGIPARTWRVNPTPINTNWRYLRSNGKGASWDNYGDVSRKIDSSATPHTPLMWSFPQNRRGGGLARAQVRKDETFNQSAVQINRQPIYYYDAAASRKSKKDKNGHRKKIYRLRGWIFGMYGYVTVGAKHIYGWLPYASMRKIKGNANAKSPPATPGTCLTNDETWIYTYYLIATSPECPQVASRGAYTTGGDDRSPDVGDAQEQPVTGPIATGCESCNEVGVIEDGDEATRLIGDVDGDGAHDAVLVSGDTGDVTVARSNGQSLRGSSIWLHDFVADPDWIGIGDVNADGRSDLVALSGGSWSVALSSGSGFDESSEWISGFGEVAQQVFVGDVTGDHRADAIVLDSSGSWVVAVSDGESFGRPRIWRSIGTTDDSFGIVADADGDGTSDAITFSVDAEGTTAWSVAKSDGREFGSWGTWNTGFGAESTDQFVEDVDGDGKADAVTLDRDTGDWTVAKSSGTAFTSDSAWLSGFADFSDDGEEADSTFLADFSGDGKADAVQVIGGSWGVAPSTGSQFQGYSKMLEDEGEMIDQRIYGDVDGDGKTDLITHSSVTQTWSAHLSEGSKFANPVEWRADDAHPVSKAFLGDVDNDGDDDLVMYDDDEHVVRVAVSNGESFLTPATWLSLDATGKALLLASVTADAAADLITVDDDGTWAVAVSTSSSFYSPASWKSGLGSGSTIPLAADVTGDGEADAISVDPTTGEWSVAPSNGSYFTSTSIWATGLGTDAVAYLADDLDGDGKADGIALTNTSDTTWNYALSSTSAFGTHRMLFGDLGSGSLDQVVADFDGDSKPDLLVSFDDGSQASWWADRNLNLGDSTGADDVGPPRSFGTPTSWLNGPDGGSASLVGDVNGDGRKDAVSADGSMGNWNVSLSSGSAGNGGFKADSDGGDHFDSWATDLGASSGIQLLGDVNGDEMDDAVAVWVGGTWFESSVAVTVALSDGTRFLAPDPTDPPTLAETFPSGLEYVLGAMLGDVDGDGCADLVLRHDSGTLRVALGTTGGSFGSLTSWLDDIGWMQNLLIADVDGDGDDDVVKFDQGNWDAAKSDGSSFAPPAESNPWTPNFGYDSDAQFVQDVDGDGAMDAVAYYADTGLWSVSEHADDGDDTVRDWRDGFGFGADRVLMGDVSGDGRSDATSVTFASGDADWAVSTSDDDDAPSTEFTGGPVDGGVTNSDGVVIAFEASEQSTYECSLDSASFTPCSPPVEFDSLSEGTHSVAVRATDIGGNVEAPAATESFEVDTLAPDTTITDGPEDSSLITKAKAIIEFEASEPGAKFKCTVDGASPKSCTSPLRLVGLASATHSVVVSAVDRAGNEDSTPASVSFDVDAATSRPTTSIDSAPADPSADRYPTFAFSGSGGATAFECSLDSSIWEDCSSPWTVALDPDTDANHKMDVRAVNDDGYVDLTPATYSWTGDLVAPSLDVTEPQANSDLGDGTVHVEFSSGDAVSFSCAIDGNDAEACDSGDDLAVGTSGPHDVLISAEDSLGNAASVDTAFTVLSDLDTSIEAGPNEPTNESTPYFAFSSNHVGADFECKLDDGDWSACEAESGVDLLGVDDGAHVLHVRASYGGLSDGSPEEWTFERDTTAPQIGFDQVPPASVSATSVTFQFSIDTFGASIWCQIDSGSYDGCNSPYETNVTLTEGPHTLRVYASDHAGNDSDVSSYTFVIDRTAPTTTVTESPASTTADATPRLAFAGSEAEDIFVCAIDGGSPISCRSPFEMLPLEDGEHSVTIAAVDPAGNVDPTPELVEFEVAYDGPETAMDSGPTNGTMTNLDDAEFAFSSLDATEFECSIDYEPFATCESPQSLEDLPDGRHSFRVRAVNASGIDDSSPAYRSFTVDSAPPDIDITGPESSLDRSLGVNFTVSDATTATLRCKLDDEGWDTCESPWQLEDLSDGTHRVHVKGTDKAGNVAETAADVVVDATAPQIGALFLFQGEADPTRVVAFSADRDADFQCWIDDEAPAACNSPYTSPAMDPGSHTINIRATDDYGSSTTSGMSTDVAAALGGAPTFTSGPSGTTSDSTPSYEVDWPNDGPVSSLNCAIDGESTACQANVSSTLPLLANGSHTLQAWSFGYYSGIYGSSPVATRTFTVSTGNTEPDTTTSDDTYVISGGSDDVVSHFSSSDPGAEFECSFPSSWYSGGFAVPPPSLAVTGYSACASPYRTIIGGRGAASTYSSVDVRAVNGDTVDPTPLRFTVFGNHESPELSVLSGPDQGEELTDDHVIVRFRSSDPYVNSRKCSIDGAEFSSCTSPFDLDGLDDGDHAVAIRVSDEYGNSTQIVRSFSVDTGGTAVPDTSAPDTSAENRSSQRNGIVISHTVAFQLNATEDATFECRLDSDPFTACTFSDRFSTSGVSDGPHTFEARATDSASNTDATPAHHEFTVDTTGPTITLSSPTTGAEIHTGSLTVRFTANETVMQSICIVDFVIIQECNGATGGVDEISSGSHFLYVVALDLGGNVNYSGASVTRRDHPETTITAGPTEGSTLGGSSTSIGFNSTDPAATFKCSLDGAAATTCNSPAGLTNLSSGPHTFSVYAVSPDSIEDPSPATRSFNAP